MYKTLICIAFFSQICFAQYPDKDFYHLYKGGKKYPKIEKYILAPLDEIGVNKKKGSFKFHIYGETFIHNPDQDMMETISTSEMEKLRFSSISELLEEKEKIYYKRHEEQLLENGHNLPPPLGYDYFKVSLVIVENENFAKAYEVYWIYTN